MSKNLIPIPSAPDAVCTTNDVPGIGNMRKMSKNNVQQSLPTSAIFLTSTLWPSGPGKISIKFNGGSGNDAWSYIGSISNLYNSEITGTKGRPSMNLDWIDPPTESFTWSRPGEEPITYPIELFKTEYRKGCTNYIEYVGGPVVNVVCPTPENCSKYSDLYNCNERPWVPGGVIMHEFGHAMGMAHEHQNFKDNPLDLNRDNIYDYYLSQGKTIKDANNNVICLYGADTIGVNCASDDTIGSSFDPESVMLYRLANSWVNGENPTKLNYEYSQKDVEWLSTTYKAGPNYRPQITIEFLNGEQWQQAWVEKVVTEKLAPNVNIDFNFTNEYFPLPEYVIDETKKRTGANIIRLLTELNLKNPLVITAIAIASFIVLLFLYNLLQNLRKRTK